MQQSNLYKVPAGKKPKHVTKPKNTALLLFMNLLHNLVYKRWFFVILSFLIVIPLLVTINYFDGFVYFVVMNDEPIGMVKDDKDVKDFIDDLTEKCGSFYGMDATYGDTITFIKEHRPDSDPNLEQVKDEIRQNISLLIKAYMVTVNGEPVLPVNAESDLNDIVQSLKAKYTIEDGNTRVIDAYIIESIDTEPCNVPPPMVTAPDVIVSILSDEDKSIFHASAADNVIASQEFRHSDFINEDHFLTAQGNSGNETGAKIVPLSNASVTIKTLEEMTVIESIPYPVEHVYDDDLWIVQREVLSPGEEGIKEIVYYITRENGIEFQRTKLAESILKEPVTQLEARGTAKVPSIGTGRFIWPVEIGGEVTPGRGFSEWHTGIDIGAAQGSNILAADSGVVWFSGYGRTQGYYIIVYHGNYWTLYLHNSVNLVSQGQKVMQGEVIARVGSTGRSTGPHLHFEVRIDDGTGEWHTYYQHKPVDPLKYFRP